MQTIYESKHILICIEKVTRQFGSILEFLDKEWFWKKVFEIRFWQCQTLRVLTAINKCMPEVRIELTTPGLQDQSSTTAL